MTARAYGDPRVLWVIIDAVRRLVWLACTACSTSFELTIERVDPASSTTATAVPVLRIEGSGFPPPIVSSIDDGTTRMGEIAATIGDTPLTNVVWRDETLVEASVPADLSAGRHDVTLTLGPHTGVLVEGYTVLACKGLVDRCAEPLPTMPVDIQTMDTINTDSDPRCRTVAQPLGRDVCLVYATEVTIGASGSLTATGSRPLAIAATGTMTIAGTLDVSSRLGDAQRGPAADDPGCSFGAVPEQDTAGSGGGAGGSFGTIGGDGGVGDTNLGTAGDGVAEPGRAAPIDMIVGLRGGCRAQSGADSSASSARGGAGGSSGGALYLYATHRIEVSGGIRAGGAGGDGGEMVSFEGAGGGGGGSGGLVVIESASIVVTGQISANGGGGGAGGLLLAGVQRNGMPGADGAAGSVPAPGGRIGATQGLARIMRER